MKPAKTRKPAKGKTKISKSKSSPSGGLRIAKRKTVPAPSELSKRKRSKTEMSDQVTAFKAFNADMTCRGFQFEIGATYQHAGRVQICESGFHACLVPFDCWNYYEGSRTFAQVKCEAPQNHTDDSKIVTGRITIEASLNLPAWIKKQVETIWDICRASKTAVTTGYRAHAASTGYGAHAASTGDGAHAASTGDGAHAASTGDRAHAASTGYGAHAASTGYGAHAASTGDGAHAASTGYGAHASALGTDALAASLGLSGRAAAGENGLVIIAYRDAQERRRVAVGYVGENGIKAKTWYRADEAGQLVEDGAAT